jgi:hypothetical protein
MTISSDGEQRVKDLQRNTKITQITERGAERRFELLDDLLTDTTLFIREPYNELLVHGKPPCHQKLPNKPPNQQPQFLALKRH